MFSFVTVSRTIKCVSRLVLNWLHSNRVYPLPYPEQNSIYSCKFLFCQSCVGRIGSIHVPKVPGLPWRLYLHVFSWPMLLAASLVLLLPYYFLRNSVLFCFWFPHFCWPFFRHQIDGWNSRQYFQWIRWRRSVYATDPHCQLSVQCSGHLHLAAIASKLELHTIASTLLL